MVELPTLPIPGCYWERVARTWLDVKHLHHLFAWRWDRLMDSKAEHFALGNSYCCSSGEVWVKRVCSQDAFVRSSGDALQVPSRGWSLALIFWTSTIPNTWVENLWWNDSFYLVLTHHNNVIHASTSTVHYNWLDSVYLKIRLLIYTFPTGQFPILPGGRNFPDLLSQQLFVGREPQAIGFTSPGAPLRGGRVWLLVILIYI